jgi:protein O-mannosyl-transferase
MPWYCTRWARWFAAALIALAVIAAYANSFHGEFIYDDDASIPNNPTIRRLWQIGKVLSPPPNGETVSERPLLNLTFAVNYALHGKNVEGYHAANLVIHILAAWVLFGILRRTFLLPVLRERWSGISLPLAFAISVLWAVHPLQTESVTYMVQRAESLMGLFYLLTLYCVIRGAESTATGGANEPAPIAVPATTKLKNHQATAKRHAAELLWYAAATLACLLGMATKEVMVTAPVIVLFYDRAFLSGSFRQAMRYRWGLYAALAATWMLLAYFVVSTGLLTRRREMVDCDAWSYARTQPLVVLDYLRLSLWPYPQCIRYTTPVIQLAPAIPGLLAAAAIMGAVVLATVNRKRWAFFGVWFLLILAPSSSVLPLTPMEVEHRMYLPLAAVLALAVIGAWELVKYVHNRGWLPLQQGAALAASLFVAACASLGFLTYNRNAVYLNNYSIWTDTVLKFPDNYAAYTSLGNVLLGEGKVAEAAAHHLKALDINPDYPDAHNNLGGVLYNLGDYDAAIAHFQRAVELEGKWAEPFYNYALALQKKGRTAEAVEKYNRALEIKPDFAEVHNNLGFILVAQKKPNDAIGHIQKALDIQPEFAEAYCNLGNARELKGDLDGAIADYQAALRLKPDIPGVSARLGAILLEKGRLDEAIDHLQLALKSDPQDARARNNLGKALLRKDNFDGAIVCFRLALEIDPENTSALLDLGSALLKNGRVDEAAVNFQKVLEIEPHSLIAHNNLGALLHDQGKDGEALAHWRELLELQPNNMSILYYAAWALATSADASARNGAEALDLAQRAAKLTRDRDPMMLDAMAAAYAEVGRFSDAVQAARQALDLAATQRNSALAEKIKPRIELYQSGHPWRQTAKPDSP